MLHSEFRDYLLNGADKDNPAAKTLLANLDRLDELSAEQFDAKKLRQLTTRCYRVLGELSMGDASLDSATKSDGEWFERLCRDRRAAEDCLLSRIRVRARERAKGEVNRVKAPVVS